MNKAVNDFKNLFSIIFFLIGAYFLFMGTIHIGVIALFSLLIIVFVNSDWFYSNFDVKHYNFFVAITVILLIIVNSCFIYNEMKYSTLFNKVSEVEQKSYIEYENTLFSAISPCTDKHNHLIVLMNTHKDISEADIKDANLTCYRTIANIEKQEPSETFPKEIKNLCIDYKNNLSQIAVNLSSFEYSVNQPQQSLQTRVLSYYKNVLTDTKKIRNIMNIKEPFNEKAQNLVQF